MKVIIIAGKALSGKTIARKYLEDHGYKVVINPTFNHFNFESFINKYKKTGLVFNISNNQDITALNDLLKKFKVKHQVKLIVLDIDKTSLLRRLKEARRLKMFKNEKLINSFEAYQKQYKDLNLKNLKYDYYLNTSKLNPNQLRTKLKVILELKTLDKISLEFHSFGFKNGSFGDADFIFDFRFLDNPFYLPKLKEKTGLDKPVSDFVLKNKDTQEYLKRVISVIDYAIPLYLNDQRQHMIVGIGCTGGQHRSVAVVEYLYKHYSKKKYQVSKSHMDL